MGLSRVKNKKLVGSLSSLCWQWICRRAGFPTVGQRKQSSVHQLWEAEVPRHNREGGQNEENNEGEDEDEEYRPIFSKITINRWEGAVSYKRTNQLCKTTIINPRIQHSLIKKCEILVVQNYSYLPMEVKIVVENKCGHFSHETFPHIQNLCVSTVGVGGVVRENNNLVLPG